MTTVRDWVAAIPRRWLLATGVLGCVGSVAAATWLHDSLVAGVLATAVAVGVFALVGDGLDRADVATVRGAVAELSTWHRPTRRDGLLAAVAVAVAVASRVAIGAVANVLAPTADRATHSLTAGGPPSLLAVLAVAVVAVVLAPLVEEALFRGIIQRYLGHHVGTPPAIALTAGTFALLHVPAYGGFGAPLGALAVPLVVIVVDATLWGVLFEETGHVAAPALAHGGANALALVAWVV